MTREGMLWTRQKLRSRERVWLNLVLNGDHSGAGTARELMLHTLREAAARD